MTDTWVMLNQLWHRLPGRVSASYRCFYPTSVLKSARWISSHPVHNSRTERHQMGPKYLDRTGHMTTRFVPLKSQRPFKYSTFSIHTETPDESAFISGGTLLQHVSAHHSKERHIHRLHEALLPWMRGYTLNLLSQTKSKCPVQNQFNR